MVAMDHFIVLFLYFKNSKCLNKSDGERGYILKVGKRIFKGFINTAINCCNLSAPFF